MSSTQITSQEPLYNAPDNLIPEKTKDMFRLMVDTEMQKLRKHVKTTMKQLVDKMENIFEMYFDEADDSGMVSSGSELDESSDGEELRLKLKKRKLEKLQKRIEKKRKYESDDESDVRSDDSMLPEMAKTPLPVTNLPLKEPVLKQENGKAWFYSYKPQESYSEDLNRRELAVYKYVTCFIFQKGKVEFDQFKNLNEIREYVADKVLNPPAEMISNTKLGDEEKRRVIGHVLLFTPSGLKQ